MSDAVISVNGKNILLSQALKYYDNQERCQRKLSLTPKEYTLLLDKIIEEHNKQIKTAKRAPVKAQQVKGPVKGEIQVQPPQIQVQAPQIQVPQVKVQVPQPQIQVPQPQIQVPQPQIQVQVPQIQVQVQAPQPVPMNQPVPWYDNLVKSSPADNQQSNNAALLDRRFFNANTVSTPVTPFADNSNSLTAGGLRGSGFSSRVFDLVNPETPTILSRNPSNTRMPTL
jgi:hypothetical protein